MSKIKCIVLGIFLLILLVAVTGNGTFSIDESPNQTIMIGSELLMSVSKIPSRNVDRFTIQEEDIRSTVKNSNFLSDSPTPDFSLLTLGLAFILTVPELYFSRKLSKALRRKSEHA